MTQLRGIMSDVRISPNRRLLAELIALYLDAKSNEDRAIFRMLLIVTYGDSKRINWIDNADPTPGPTSRSDAEAGTMLKDVMASLTDRVTPKEPDVTDERAS